MEVTDRLVMDEVTALAVDDKPAVDDIDKPTGSISRYVRGQFKKASDARQSEETRWLKAYQNYRGVYGPDVQFTETEKSRVFIKVTKTKVLAAYGQITEVLFGNNRFPISINPTTLPEGVAESVYLDTNPQTSQLAQQAVQGTPAASEGMPRLLPGETMQELRERLGGMKKELEPVADKLKEGPGCWSYGCCIPSCTSLC